jgi:hypothetical protein
MPTAPKSRITEVQVTARRMLCIVQKLNQGTIPNPGCNRIRGPFPACRQAGLVTFLGKQKSDKNIKSVIFYFTVTHQYFLFSLMKRKIIQRFAGNAFGAALYSNPCSGTTIKKRYSNLYLFTYILTCSTFTYPFPSSYHR